MKIWVQRYKPLYFTRFQFGQAIRTDEPNEGEDQSGLRLRLQEQGEHQDQNSGTPMFKHK